MPLQRPTNTWRDWYNPLKGLTVSRIVSMEDAADRGQFADLQWFWHHMKRTDVTVQAAISRRLSFVASGDWEIRTNENADATLAAEQADLLRYAYNRIANFKDATLFLASALFRGYAHLEKIGTGYGTLVSRLEPIPQWFWVRDGMDGRWRFNQDSRSTEARGEIVGTEDFCILESSALNRAIARHFFAKQLAFADWDQALELGANQSIFFIGPPGASEEKEKEYRNVAEQMASNGRGFLPNGADVKMFDPGARSKLPFYDRIRYCDEQIVMAATGGLLSMLTESGSGTLAGGAHAAGLLALARSDAQLLSEVYQRDLDAMWLTEFFPHQPHVAYFNFDVPQQDDAVALLGAIGNLSWAGYTVEQKQLEEKTGLKLLPLPQKP